MKTTSIKIKTLSLLLFSFLCSNFIPINSQDKKENYDASFTISSKIMNEDRELIISLPKGYNKWDTYDVQYLLDPNWAIERRRGLLNFLQGNGLAKKTIIVGVVSKDRTSDMTPTNMKNFPTSGNAENFIDFIGKEVKPYIESKYKTSGHNIFAGHSFGGLCVMHALLKSPEYFDSYLVGDPSFWFDDQVLVGLAKKKLPAIEGKVLFIGARKGGAYNGMGIDSMEVALKTYAHKNLDWQIKAYEDETHNSVSYKLNYDGMKFISSDFRNAKIELVPNSGEIVSGEPLAVYSSDENENLRYTIDNTEPNFESELFKDSLMLTVPTKVKIKVPSKRSNTIPPNNAEFIQGIKLKGLKKKNRHVSGLKYKYYEFEGTFKKLPNFDTLTVTKTGIIENGFELKSFPKKQEFACVFEGYYEAKKSGYHYFAITSDDGLKFYIHDKLMIDNDYRHTAYKQKSTVLYLEAGLHPIKYEYFQFDKKAEINLFYKSPGTKGSPLGFERFWYKP